MGLRDSLAASRLGLQSDFKLESVELRADPMHQVARTQDPESKVGTFVKPEVIRDLDMSLGHEVSGI